MRSPDAVFLERVVNYLFLEFCAAGDDALEDYYQDGWRLVENLIDAEEVAPPDGAN